MVWIALITATGVVVLSLLNTARSLHSIDAAAAPAVLHDPSAPSLETVPTSGPSVRVAVIGGMSFTGFWNDLAKRYEQDRGVHVALIATGEKNDIANVFRQGGVDVITMHASDAIINLVADGYAMDPQPWMRNDLIIVGPPDDPAGIRGMTDAAAALKKIAAARAPFVVHSSLGAQEVLLNILNANNIVLDPAQTTVLFDDRQRFVLQVAGQKHAYTLVGRIPFRIGRLPNNGLVPMVQGDLQLRRPYVVAVANPAKITGAHLQAAREFAAYLRQPQTQRWIADYGRGLIDDLPLFFAIADEVTSAAEPSVAAAAGSVDQKSLRVGGAVGPSTWSTARLKSQFATEMQPVNYASKGKQHTCDCIPLISLLKAAGAPMDLKMDPAADPKTKNRPLRLAVVVRGRDGYTALFSLAELMPAMGNRAAWLGLDADGSDLPAEEGPVKLIVPQDTKLGRWVHAVADITILDADNATTQPATADDQPK